MGVNRSCAPFIWFMIYLDNSATTRAYDEVIEKTLSMMREDYGNPSSLHALGFDAEKIIKEARRQVGNAFGAGEIVFTSGGTESDNMAIIGAYRKKKRESNRIITTRVEHPAVLETVKGLEREGAEVVYIDVDRDSRLDMDSLREAAKEGAALISVMAVNNETGALFPICHVNEVKGNALLHVDAVQALGKEDVSNLPGDLISVSGHKIHGPKGIGALFIRKGVKLDPIITGGGQEKGLRSGTENTQGIAGFGIATEKALSGLEEEKKRLREINNKLKDGILSEIKDVRINSPEDGCPSILNVSFLGTRGEVLLHSLEQKGIMVSTGSACSSGKNAHKSGSHVLKAMGLSREEIEGAIRFSFGAFNTPEEMDIVIDKVKEAVEGFRRLGSFR